MLVKWTVPFSASVPNRPVIREPSRSRRRREYVVVGVVEAECPSDGFPCGARGWRHAEEVAAVAAVTFGGRVDDLYEVDALAVDGCGCATRAPS